MTKPEIRKPWHTGKAETIPFPEKGKTDASFGNDTDVNKIVARFARTGMLPEGQQGQYEDVTALQGDLAQMICDSRNALNELKTAKENAEKEKESQIKEKLAKLENLEKQLEEKLEPTGEEQG